MSPSEARSASTNLKVIAKVLTPAQRLAHSREALDLALDHVLDAIADLTPPQAGAWVGATPEELHEKRQRVFLAHRLYALLAGGRTPPDREQVARTRLARPPVEHEHQDQDQEEQVRSGAGGRGSRADALPDL